MASRKIKPPNGLFKSALVHQAVKAGPMDDEPAFLGLSESFWSTFVAAHADCRSRLLGSLTMAEIIPPVPDKADACGTAEAVF